MKQLAIVCALALGLAATSFTARAADEIQHGDSADVERGVATLRVSSHVDSTCQIWINGTLRATIGPFGNSGIISTAPISTDRVTEVLARCENAAYQKTVKAVYNHCDFAIVVPEGSGGIMVAHCT